MSPPRAAALLALALLGAQAIPPRGAAAATVEEPTYIPAGVVDAQGTVGCLRTPEGGVEAVDLETGRSLWRSAAPARALSIARDRALLLEERAGRGLRVAAYAAREGRLMRAYDLATLALPAWASLAEARAGREWTVFEVTARLTGEALEIGYDATRRRVSGFAAPGVIAQVQGAVTVRLDSGRVEADPGSVPPQPPLPERVPPIPGVRFVSVHARTPDATLVMVGPPPNIAGPPAAGNRRFAFEVSQDTKVVIVHRWSAPGDDGEPPLRLEHGQATDTIWATLDRGHVLLRRAYEQRWYDLYSLETGKPTGRLERPADVAVVGPRIFWTTCETSGRLALNVTDVGSGRRLWRRIVRGPDPPLGPPIP
jgi:hypothetical protein